MRNKLMVIVVLSAFFIACNVYALDGELNVSGKTTLATQSGKVGIGTTNPSVPLQIYGVPLDANQPLGINGRVVEGIYRGLADSHTLLYLGANGGNNNQKAGLQFGNYSTDSIGGIFGVMTSYFGHTTGAITFDLRKVGSDTALTEVMRITNEGNIGIGTTSPKAKLDVNGAIYQRGGQLHADYVFNPDYQLESIEEHSKYMWNNKHLKAVSGRTIDENGQEVVEIGTHQKGIVEELEKAHIYIEQLSQRLNELEAKMTKSEKE